jgi:hypothetical protein
MGAVRAVTTVRVPPETLRVDLELEGWVSWAG